MYMYVKLYVFLYGIIMTHRIRFQMHTHDDDNVYKRIVKHQPCYLDATKKTDL